jgi:hypothetical protein
VDTAAASALKRRLDSSGIHVFHSDGAAMRFAGGSFSALMALETPRVPELIESTLGTRRDHRPPANDPP